MNISMSKAMADVQWALVGVVTASLAHFLLRVVLGRDLGAEGLGVYTLAFSIYLIGQQFAAFGIGSALTKYVAEYSDSLETVRKYVSSGITSSIIIGTLMGVVLFLIAPIIAVSFFGIPELEDMIHLIAISFPFIALQKAVLGTLNGFRKMRTYAFLNMLQNVSVVALSIILVLFLETGLIGSVIGFVAPTMVIGALCPLLIRDSIDMNNCFWDKPAFHATIAFGFYVGIGNAIGFLNTQIDSILIGYYMDPFEVGIYAVAILLAQVLTLIPSAVQRVTAPATAMLFGKGDINGVRRLFYNTLKKSLLVSIVIAILIAIISPYIISFIFTEVYLPSFTPLLILLLGYTIGGSFGAVGATLSSIGKVNIPVRIGAACGVLNVVLNILLIPVLGINGAAMATTITIIINIVITIKIIQNYI